MSSSHFDAIADGYDESLPAHVVEHYLRKRTAFISRHCPPGLGLDVGCGTGALAKRLVQCGYDMVGVDPSQGMLDVLRRRAPAVEGIQASGMELPFSGDHFQLVLTVATLHHIADPQDVRKTLEEMVRVLRPSGRIVIWDHNPANPYWRSLMARVPQDTGEERLISQSEILSGVLQAGGRVVISKRLGWVPDFTPRRALRVAEAVERAAEQTPLLRRLAAHNVIVATK